MSSILAEFDVTNQDTGGIRRIQVLEGIEDAHLECVLSQWRPRLIAARERAVIALNALPKPEQTREAWQRKQGIYGAPDSHWDWKRKADDMLPASQRMLALVDGEMVEGLMRIDLAKTSRLKPSPSTQLVYVDYIAVAPWNRPLIEAKPRYRGFGSVLLGTAIAISEHEDMQGRCGLHSLLQSEDFYRKAGMTDLGCDAAVDGLRYFEFAPDAAKKFKEL